MPKTQAGEFDTSKATRVFIGMDSRENDQERNGSGRLYGFSILRIPYVEDDWRVITGATDKNGLRSVEYLSTESDAGAAPTLEPITTSLLYARIATAETILNWSDQRAPVNIAPKS